MSTNPKESLTQSDLYYNYRNNRNPYNNRNGYNHTNYYNNRYNPNYSNYNNNNNNNNFDRNYRRHNNNNMNYSNFRDNRYNNNTNNPDLTFNNKAQVGRTMMARLLPLNPKTKEIWENELDFGKKLTDIMAVKFYENEQRRAQISINADDFQTILDFKIPTKSAGSKDDKKSSITRKEKKKKQKEKLNSKKHTKSKSKRKHEKSDSDSDSDVSDSFTDSSDESDDDSSSNSENSESDSDSSEISNKEKKKHPKKTSTIKKLQEKLKKTQNNLKLQEKQNKINNQLLAQQEKDLTPKKKLKEIAEPATNTPSTNGSTTRMLHQLNLFNNEKEGFECTECEAIWPNNFKCCPQCTRTNSNSQTLQNSHNSNSSDLEIIENFSKSSKKLDEASKRQQHVDFYLKGLWNNLKKELRDDFKRNILAVPASEKMNWDKVINDPDLFQRICDYFNKPMDTRA